jgi:hypothetical protein
MRELLRKILDLGVTSDTPLDLAIALRATNLMALFMIVFSAIAAAASVLDLGSPIATNRLARTDPVFGGDLQQKSERPVGAHHRVEVRLVVCRTRAGIQLGDDNRAEADTCRTACGLH